MQLFCNYEQLSKAPYEHFEQRYREPTPGAPASVTSYPLCHCQFLKSDGEILANCCEARS